MYCTTSDSFRYAGITISEVSDANMKEFVLDAEIDCDRDTFTTYWNAEVTNTASSGGNTTLTLTSAGWTADDYINDYLWIYGGTGIGQMLKITDNDTDTVTVEEAWATNPDNTSTFRIIHSAQDPRLSEELNGTNTDRIQVTKYPVKEIVTVTIKDDSVTTTTISKRAGGILQLSDDSESSKWLIEDPPVNDISYRYGVFPVPREIKKLCAIKSAILALNSQMGGTHNIPATVTNPEGSYSVGQAYINIKSTIDSLQKQHDKLIERIRKYPNITM